MTRASAAFLLILLTSCAVPPQPVPVPAAPAAATPPEISTIVVPVRTSLAPLIPLIEAQVPKSIDRTDAYELDPQQRFGLKYRVQRDPIALKMLGSELHAATTVRYALEGCTRTRNPINGAVAMWPCISCGFHEPMREAIIELQSRLDWAADWTVRSTTIAHPVQFPNRCAVTLFSIGITDWKLRPLVDQQLQDVAKSIDRNTPKLAAIRPAAQRIWSSLQEPYEIAPRTWLVLEPIDVALAPIRGSGLEVTSALALHARTSIVVGDKPAPTARPLPALISAEPNETGMRVPFDLQIPYDEASRLLTEQFGGREYRKGGSTIAVESIRLSRGEAGRINVEASVDFRGGGLKRYRGLVFLEGSPQFDVSTNNMAIPDLRYKIDPRRKNLFLRTFDRIAHDQVEQQLRAGAVWSLAQQFGDIRAEVARGLTRQLSPGVLLAGRVDTIQPLAIVAGPKAISVRIVVTGTAEVEVKEWR